MTFQKVMTYTHNFIEDYYLLNCSINIYIGLGLGGEEEKFQNDGKSYEQKKSGTAMGDEELADQMNKITVVDGKAISGDTDINDQLQETNVGKRLGAKTNKIVIILILAIMISIPQFSSETYQTITNEYYGSLYGTSLHLRDVGVTFRNTVTGNVDNTNFDEIYLSFKLVRIIIYLILYYY